MFVCVRVYMCVCVCVCVGIICGVNDCLEITVGNAKEGQMLHVGGHLGSSIILCCLFYGVL